MNSNRNRGINLSEVAAIIFDTDGVLTDTASIHAWSAALNFGFGKVSLRKRLNAGDSCCEVCIYVKNDEESAKEDGIIYTRQSVNKITEYTRVRFDACQAVRARERERIWKREGLKVPKKQPKRRRLWLNDGSCVRLRPEHKDHIWSYDFVTAWTTNGKAFRILVIIDEYTRECLALLVARHITSQVVIDQLYELFLLRGVPEHIRSDNGPEFTAKAIRKWLNRVGVKALFIEPGSPWENGYVESFNGKLRDELLNGEIFTTLTEARILIEQWRREYNHFRPHSALGYRPPAPEAKMPTALTL